MFSLFYILVRRFSSAFFTDHTCLDMYFVWPFHKRCNLFHKSTAKTFLHWGVHTSSQTTKVLFVYLVDRIHFFPPSVQKSWKDSNLTLHFLVVLVWEPSCPAVKSKKVTVLIIIRLMWQLHDLNKISLGTKKDTSLQNLIQLYKKLLWVSLFLFHMTPISYIRTVLMSLQLHKKPQMAEIVQTHFPSCFCIASGFLCLSTWKGCRPQIEILKVISSHKADVVQILRHILT